MTCSLDPTNRLSVWQAAIPGALTAFAIALAATFISEHYSRPLLH